MKARFVAGAGFEVHTIFGCEVVFRGELGGGDNKARRAAYADVAIAADKISAGVAGVQIMGGQCGTGFAQGGGVFWHSVRKLHGVELDEIT